LVLKNTYSAVFDALFGGQAAPAEIDCARMHENTAQDNHTKENL